jgi:hypothetical protein
MVARSTLMHKHTIGPLRAGLGNRDCHTAPRALDNCAPTRRYGCGRRLLRAMFCARVLVAPVDRGVSGNRPRAMEYVIYGRRTCRWLRFPGFPARS